MTILSSIQKVCARLAITQPNAAVTSSDPQVLQLLAYANEEGEELSQRYDWQSLVKEATFTTVATESQGSISTLAAGLKFIINDTIWNRTLIRPVYGPLTESRWQEIKAQPYSGPFNEYRIRGDLLLFTPVPTAGETCAFEYVTKNFVNTSVGGTSETWTNDADTFALDEQILVLGIMWRFKAAKGFDYAEDFNKYERRVVDAMSRDGTKDTLRLSGPHDYHNSINIPIGNWNL